MDDTLCVRHLASKSKKKEKQLKTLTELLTILSEDEGEQLLMLFSCLQSHRTLNKCAPDSDAAALLVVLAYCLKYYSGVASERINKGDFALFCVKKAGGYLKAHAQTLVKSTS